MLARVFGLKMKVRVRNEIVLGILARDKRAGACTRTPHVSTEK